MAVDIDTLRKKSPLPLDANTLRPDGTPFESLEEAHGAVNEAYICVGDKRIILIEGEQVEHWYANGKTLAHLIVCSDQSNTVTKVGTEPQNIETPTTFSAPLQAQDLHITGSLTINDIVKLNMSNVPIYDNNDDALAALGEGVVYRLTGGGLALSFATAPVIPPLFDDKISSGTQRTFNGQLWQAQSSNKSWSINKASNKQADIIRVELRPGDQWPNDANSTPPNTQNGQVKERHELYSKNTTVPFDTDVWFYCAIKIEPGLDILYTNNDHYCDLFQWHQSGGSGGPPMNIDLSGQGHIEILSKGLNSSGLSTPRGNTDIERNVWKHFLFRMRFGRTATTGQLQAWVDGNEFCNVSGIPIGYAAETNAGYMKFGVYRTAANTGNDPNGVPYKRTLAVQYANPILKYDGTSLEYLTEEENWPVID